VISQRAWLIGAVGFCFYLIAIVNTLPSFYYALTWLAAGVLASSLGIALLSLVGLRCAWRAPRAVVSSTLDEETASAATVEVELANAGTLNKTGVLIEVELARRRDQKPNSLTRRFLLEALPSGQSLTTQLPLSKLPRGRYRVVELRLVGSDVLGLFRIRKRVPPDPQFDAMANVTSAAREASGAEPIIVGPATVLPVEHIALQFAAARGAGGVPATRFPGHGDELRGTRLYAPGDDLRYVHWHSTARRGQLVVKEFHHTQQTRALVVWDGAADAAAGEPDGDCNALEWGLCLAASVCRALEERNQPCALLRLDAHPLHLGGESAPHTPGGAFPNATPSAAQVAEALADARADRTTPLDAAMNAARPAMDYNGSTHAAPMSGELFLITASLAPEVVQAVARRRAGGARISVALLHAAAFGKTPTPAARENYEAQFRALRAAGAHVVAVEPRENASAGAVLGAALYALLHPEPAGAPRAARVLEVLAL
jgi:uncharacterized protein (DUF58 family)